MNDRAIQHLLAAARCSVSTARALGQPSAARHCPRAAMLLARAEAEIAAARAALQPAHIPAAILIVQETIARLHGFTGKDLRSAAKPNPLALARAIAVGLCRELLTYSCETVGASFGGRHHGSVVHACRAIAERCETDFAVSVAYQAAASAVRVALLPLANTPGALRPIRPQSTAA